MLQMQDRSLDIGFLLEHFYCSTADTNSNLTSNKERKTLGSLFCGNFASFGLYEARVLLQNKWLIESNIDLPVCFFTLTLHSHSPIDWRKIRSTTNQSELQKLGQLRSNQSYWNWVNYQQIKAAENRSTINQSACVSETESTNHVTRNISESEQRAHCHTWFGIFSIRRMYLRKSSLVLYRPLYTQAELPRCTTSMKLMGFKLLKLRKYRENSIGLNIFHSKEMNSVSGHGSAELLNWTSGNLV